MKDGADVAAFVLDSSVTVAWFVAGEASSATDALLDRIVAEGAIVPSLWPLEVGNALLVAERHGRLASAQRRRALAALLRLPIEIDPETALHAWDSALALAERFGLTLYDATYLELAQRGAIPIATLDRELRVASAALGIAVLGT